MALSAFDDKARPPQAAELAAALGPAASRWDELRQSLGKRIAPLSEEWGFTSKSTGWGLRLKQGKRVLLYMTPCRGYFLASTALGEKAARAAHEAGLPAPLLAIIDGAPRYAEGRGVRLEVRTARDVRNAERLVAIKAES